MNFKNYFSRVSVVTLVIFLLLMLAGSQQLRAQGSWDTVGTVGFSAGMADYTSLALDASGTPYVVYADAGNSNKATVMKFDGSNWVTVGIAGFSAGTVYYTSLALDGSGTPYVAYQDWGNTYKATVMKFNGTSWVTVGTAGFSAGTADFTSLTLDGSGNPYVAYTDYANSYKATVMKFDGTSWVTVGTAGFSADEADFTSLALDGSGTPYVAYTDYANSYKATVMKFNGTGWVTLGTAGFSADAAYFISLALDGSGTPYVVYLDYANSSKATVMKFDGSSWNTVGTAGFSAGVARYTNLALNGSGSPYVAYQDWGNSYKATVMKFGSNQTPVADAGTNQTVIVNETVQLDGSGSSDPDNNPLTYGWSFYSKPAGSSTALSSTTIVNPTFVPDVAGDYVVQLVVNNGTADSPPTQVTITALSTQQAIEDIVDLIITMNLHNGLTNALTNKFNDAITYLNSGDNKEALGTLNAFINQVEAQSGKKLTAEQADQLIAEARRIINAINASSLSKQSVQTITQSSVPHLYNLEQNYPNPFNPTTQIQFAIPIAGNVTLKIYNSLGQLVKTLADGNMSAGYHTVTWNATDNSGNKLSSGVYFYRITAESFVQVRKMILMK